MINASGQRGGPPLHHPFKSKPSQAKSGNQAGNYSGYERPGGKQDVKFGGGMADTMCAGLVKVVPPSIFEKITEVFLAGFLAQDVLAMWLPRVWTSLQTGREKYDPSTDPQVRNRPFNEQARVWARKNLDGLNWVNFNEETKREFATGPGLLAVPAFMFLANRYLGNQARELSYSSLTGMGQGFLEHLEKQAPKSADEYWTKHVTDYIASTFADPEFKNAHGAYIKDWSQRWANVLKKEAGLGRWERFNESRQRFFGWVEPSSTEKLAQELKETIRNFNQSSTARTLMYPEKLEDFQRAIIRDAAPLHHAEHTWVSYRPSAFQKAERAFQGSVADEALRSKAEGLCHQVSVSHLTGDLKRFGGLVQAVWQNYEKQKGGTAITEVVGQTTKSLAGSKLFLGIGTMVLAGAYLMKLAFWAQNHQSYQAVRLLKHDAARGQETGPAQPTHHHTATGHMKIGLPPSEAKSVFSSAGKMATGMYPAYSYYAPKAYPSKGQVFAAASYPAGMHQAGFQGRPLVTPMPVADWRQA